jgi:hypothetical protein
MVARRYMRVRGQERYIVELEERVTGRGSYAVYEELEERVAGIGSYSAARLCISL